MEIPKLNKWLGIFRRSLDQLDFSCGLLYSNPNIPHITYGFHDIVAITGLEMMATTLTHHAPLRARELFAGLATPDELAEWKEKADDIVENLPRLYNAEQGIFYAGSHDCRQADIMGSGLASGLSSPEIRRSVADYYVKHKDNLFYQGMTRGTEDINGWQKLLIDFPKGEYINGGYWFHGTGCILPTLYEFYPEFALELLEELVDTLPRRKFAECVSANTDSEKCHYYMISVSIPLLSVRAIKSGRPMIDFL